MGVCAGGVVENEVCQAVVAVQKNDQLNWIGGVDACVAVVMRIVNGSGERKGTKWRVIEMVGAIAKQW